MIARALAVLMPLLVPMSARAGSEPVERVIGQLTKELEARTKVCGLDFEALQRAVRDKSGASSAEPLAATAAKSCGAAYDDMESVPSPDPTSYRSFQAVDHWWGVARQQTFDRAASARTALAALRAGKGGDLAIYEENARRQAAEGDTLPEYLADVRASLVADQTVKSTPHLGRAAARKVDAFRASVEKQAAACVEAFSELQHSMHIAETTSGPTPALQAFAMTANAKCETARERLQSAQPPKVGDDVEAALSDWIEAISARSSQQAQAGLAAAYYSKRPDGRDWEVYRQSSARQASNDLRARMAVAEARRLVGLK